ncbi:MAG: type IV toxin-antitoxin system AbiEi family antitoxin domain-containing protein [Proteobacteria bacterium]|nr:type IV toxin-antitoxin system AbiEi family antitoxin domain-containing protein [Pseudomonadota bacterium]
MPSASNRAIEIIKKNGGIIKTSNAISKGIHPRTLYELRDNGTIEQIVRGVYRLTELEAISNPDLVAVASKFPNAVICLISALSFHNITTQIPHDVSIAINRVSRSPKIDYPPISVYRFSKESFIEGIEYHEVDGITIKVYSAEKTVADCFKFRNKIGMEVVLEAIKFYKSRKKFNLEKLLEYGKICRVQRIMMPYLEVMI